MFPSMNNCFQLLIHTSSEQVKFFFELKNQKILAAIKILILISRDSTPAFPTPKNVISHYQTLFIRQFFFNFCLDFIFSTIPLIIGKIARIENEILRDSINCVTISMTYHWKSFLGLPELGLIFL